MFIFIPAGGFTFYKGYTGVCKRPTDQSTITWYRACQGVLCVAWFIFSIIRAGCFDGWMRISFLNKFDDGAAKFCIFLTVLESLGYLASMILGVICVIRISSVRFIPSLRRSPMNRSRVTSIRRRPACNE